MTDKDITQDELDAIDGVDFGAKSQPEIMSVDEIEKSEPEPEMGSPEWQDFVMRQFKEDELDPNGNPLVHGLRRVSRKLLGPAVYSGPAPGLPFQGPQFVPGLENVGKLAPTTVSYLLRIRVERDGEPYEATYADVADVYFGNTDPDFLRWPSSFACTRAEARCYRKALQIKGVAGDELTYVAPADSAVDGKATPSQLNMMNFMCKRNNINLMNFINSGDSGAKYESPYDIPYAKAEKMNEILSGFQNKGKVPEKLVGYDKNWEKKLK